MQADDERKGSRRKLKGKKKRTASIHHTDDLGLNQFRNTVASTLRRDSPTTEQQQSSQPAPAHDPPPIPTQQNLQAPVTSPTVTDLSNNEYQLAHYQLMIVLSNRSLREALGVALGGVPLLESLQAPDSILTHLESSVLPQDLPFDPAILSAFERIVRLRRNITNSTNPDVVEFDGRVTSAILRVRDQIPRRRE